MYSVKIHKILWPVLTCIMLLLHICCLPCDIPSLLLNYKVPSWIKTCNLMQQATQVNETSLFQTILFCSLFLWCTNLDGVALRQIVHCRFALSIRYILPHLSLLLLLFLKLQITNVWQKQ